MANSVGYTQRHYQKKQHIKAEKLGSHWKLKDRNVSSKSNIMAMMATLRKQIHGNLC